MFIIFLYYISMLYFSKMESWRNFECNCHHHHNNSIFDWSVCYKFIVYYKSINLKLYSTYWDILSLYRIICLGIRRKGASGDISGFPFIAGVLGFVLITPTYTWWIKVILPSYFRCSLWLRYGMLMRDSAMIVVNAVGLALQLCYVFMYYLYATNKVLPISISMFLYLNN